MCLCADTQNPTRSQRPKKQQTEFLTPPVEKEKNKSHLFQCVHCIGWNDGSLNLLKLLLHDSVSGLFLTEIFDSAVEV